MIVTALRVTPRSGTAGLHPFTKSFHATVAILRFFIHQREGANIPWHPTLLWCYWNIQYKKWQEQTTFYYKNGTKNHNLPLWTHLESIQIIQFSFWVILVTIMRNLEFEAKPMYFLFYGSTGRILSRIRQKHRNQYTLTNINCQR